VCQEQGVRGYPTLIFYHNGKKIDVHAQERSIASFSNFIDNLVKTNDKETDPFATSKEIEDELTKTSLLDEDLSETNFYIELSKPGLFFVKFYAPWCSHCKAIAQTWKALSREVGGRIGIRIGAVDCTVVPELCKEIGINGYPTLLLFKDGAKYKDYQESRRLEDLLSFIKSNMPHEDL